MYKGVKFEYRTSLEKWEGIRRFAVKSCIDTKYADAMIARIKKFGDAELPDSYEITIESIMDYFHVMYSDGIHPCAHCNKYDICKECPLYGGENNCCDEWAAAKTHAMELLESENIS